MRDLDSGKAPDKTKPRAAASRVPSIAPHPAGLSQPAALTPEDMIALQRSVGNAAVVRALQREAHQHSAGCEHGEQSVAHIQRNAVHEVLQSSRGRSLPESVQRDAEYRLGTARGTFQSVEIHDSPKDREVSRSIGAIAFTSGTNVVGDVTHHETLLHELAHVDQQMHGTVPGTDMGDGLKISDVNDWAERDAAARAARGVAAPAAVQHTEAAGRPLDESKPAPASAEPAQEMAVQRAPQPGNNWDKSLVFDRSKDAIRYGRDTWGPAMDTMPEGKKRALKDYTAEPKADFELGRPTYRETNKYLRGQFVENAGHDGIDMVKSQVRALRKALDVRPLPNNVIVARGSDFLPDGMDKAPWRMKGRKITELGFLSTSLGPSPVGAYKDKAFIFRFRVPKGTPAMWMEYISHFGSGELELLLKDHCEYKVDEVTPEKNKYGQTQWYIDATIQKPSDQVVEQQVKKAEKTGKYVVQHGSHQGGSHQYASSHNHHYSSAGASGYSQSKYPAKNSY